MPMRPPTSPSPASTSGWPSARIVASPSVRPWQNASSRRKGAEHAGTDAFARGLDLCPPAFRPGANLLREQAAEIAVRARLPLINVFGDAAGKRQLLHRRPPRQRIEPQQRASASRGRSSVYRLEQTIRHPSSQSARGLRCQLGADLEINAEFGAETGSGFFDAHNAPRRIEADE